MTRYPRGELPILGWHCPSCKTDVVESEAAEEAQHMASRLGLFEPEFPLLRKLTRSGGQLALYVPREIERALGLVAGRRVRVFIRGDEIIIDPA